MIYKELLVSVSTLLSYVPLPLSLVQTICSSVSRGQCLLLMQAHVLSTEDTGSAFVEDILANSSR